MRHLATLLLFVSLAVLAPFAGAQDGLRVPIPSKIPRETVKADDGRLEWKEWVEKTKEHRCVTCKGDGEHECLFCTRIDKFVERETCPECDHEPTPDRDKPNKSKCRTCAGKGFQFDILAHAPCPTCSGAAVVECPRCGGDGGYPSGATSDYMIKCTVCKGEGHFACRTCRGERLVEAARVKPSVAEADSKKLEKALEELADVEKALKKMAPTADGRKNSKIWAKDLRKSYRTFPPLKDAASVAAELSKDLASGPRAEGQDTLTRNEFDRRLQAIEHYLAYQRRALELALERQKHNDAIED